VEGLPTRRVKATVLRRNVGIESLAAGPGDFSPQHTAKAR
jgi:hypothetical protein